VKKPVSKFAFHVHILQRYKAGDGTSVGTAHAVIFWWECDLGPGGGGGGKEEDNARDGNERITISTSPSRNGVRDHWRQGVRPLPRALRIPAGAQTLQVVVGRVHIIIEYSCPICPIA
jgi:hypothetical protein